MKTRFVFLLAVCAVAAISAEPLTLVNTLADRPLFNLVNDGVTQSRTLAPGNRVNVDAQLFSGLGLKAVPLVGGQIYYLAKFGALPSLYQLPADQVLILNQSGQPVNLTINDGVSGVVASGGFALGSASPELTVSWDDQGPQTLAVEGGHIYRLLLASPDGVGTAIRLNRWD